MDKIEKAPQVGAKNMRTGMCAHKRYRKKRPQDRISGNAAKWAGGMWSGKEALGVGRGGLWSGHGGTADIPEYHSGQ